MEIVLDQTPFYAESGGQVALAAHAGPPICEDEVCCTSKGSICKAKHFAGACGTKLCHGGSIMRCSICLHERHSTWMFFPVMQIGDQGHFYAGSSDSEASSSGSAVVFVEDTHKAGGGALVVHHGRLESGDLHVGQMVSLV